MPSWVETRKVTPMGKDGSRTGMNGCGMGRMVWQTCQTHWMKHHRPKTKYLRDGWPCMVLWRCKRAAPISGCITLEFQLPWLPICTRWTQSHHIHDFSPGHVQWSSTSRTQTESDDRPFRMGGRLICWIWLMPIGRLPLVTEDGEGIWG